MSTASFVQVNVGGFPYFIALSDIEKFPGSFFECMIKKEWTKDSVEAISIQRDGALFKFVNAYIVNGHLPRDKDGLLDLDDATLDGLKEEADFYGLDALSKECNTQRRRGSELDLHSFVTIRKYIAKYPRAKGNLQIDLTSRLVRALKCVWSPFCVRGTINSYSSYKNLYGASSVNKINIDELIAAATQSPFGRGTETVVDTTVRNSFEIDASLLDAAALSAIARQIKCDALVPQLGLTLRPYKLVIYKEGGHFDAHRDTVRGDGHIGTLVVILNSTYTGGELEVTHGDCTEVVTGSYNWVAMYGDCLHKINPVISGVRVSLIYDIYGKEPSLTSHGDEDYRFWANQPKGGNTPKETSGGSRGPSEADIVRVYDALDEDLESFGTIIICLQHLYPECQTNPAFLKGGDRALYDILTSGTSKYDVQVVAATIYRNHDYEDADCNTTQGALFSPSIVKRTLGIKTDSDTEEEAEAPLKKQKVDPDAGVVGGMKLVIPNNLNPDSLLDYTPYIEHTGNESQAEETVYIVAGLQVRRKA